MATPDSFEAAYPASNDQLADLVRRTVHNAVPVTGDRWLRTDGLDVTFCRYEREREDEDLTWYFEALGFQPRAGIDFLLSKFPTPEGRLTGEVAMFATVLGFLEEFPGDAVLLHYGERVILERYSGGVALDAEFMDDWLSDGDNEPLERLLMPYPRRKLRQPLV